MRRWLASLASMAMGLLMGPPGHKPNTARPRLVLGETEESRQRRSVQTFVSAPARTIQAKVQAQRDDADRLAQAEAKRARKAAKRLKDARPP